MPEIKASVDSLSLTFDLNPFFLVSETIALGSCLMRIGIFSAFLTEGIFSTETWIRETILVEAQ